MQVSVYENTTQMQGKSAMDFGTIVTLSLKLKTPEKKKQLSL